MGFVLQLSFASEDGDAAAAARDPEGWTAAEVCCHVCGHGRSVCRRVRKDLVSSLRNERVMIVTYHHHGGTAAEVDGYDGWGHDAGRVWRKGESARRRWRRRFGGYSAAGRARARSRATSRRVSRF